MQMDASEFIPSVAWLGLQEADIRYVEVGMVRWSKGFY